MEADSENHQALDDELGEEDTENSENLDPLISAAQKYPSIFDLSSKKYNNSTHKEHIWQQIAETLQLDGNFSIIISTDMIYD